MPKASGFYSGLEGENLVATYKKVVLKFNNITSNVATFGFMNAFLTLYH